MIDHDVSEPPSVRELTLLGAIALAIALGFCFLAYGQLAHSWHANLDPDQYGELGRNLYRGLGLTLDPQVGPTLYRGPGYPALIAFALWISGGWYPQSIWVLQALGHAGTCLLAYEFARITLGRETARWAGFGLAVYPGLFWYTPRLWNDALLATAVTALFLLVARMIIHPRFRDAGIAGIILGGLCLIKGTFLPWIALVPGLAAWSGVRPHRSLVGLVVAALLIVLPWTVRNHQISGAWVPVHTGVAFNVKIGNEIARDFLSSPFGYGKLWNDNIDEVLALTDPLTGQGPARDLGKERIYREVIRADFQREPGLLVSHTLAAAASFWYLGETPGKTLILFLLRAPLLILGALGAVRVLRRERVAGAGTMGARALRPALWLALFFWGSHLPFAPPVRLSLPLVPLLGILAASEVVRIRRRLVGWPRAAKSGVEQAAR